MTRAKFEERATSQLKRRWRGQDRSYRLVFALSAAAKLHR